MHRNIQPTSLYGNLVLQHHNDASANRFTAFSSPSISDLFRAMGQFVSSSLKMALQHPGIQHFQLTMFAAAAMFLLLVLLLLVRPNGLLGNAFSASR